MPYISKEDREAVTKNYARVRTPGELNFLLFSYLLNAWKKYPRYDTIHCFARDFVVYPKDNSLLQQLRKDFCDIFTVSDIYAAAFCAYHEFMRRVGNKYEDKKIEENSDIYDVLAIVADIENPPLPPEGKVTVLSDYPVIPVVETEVK